MPLEGRPKWRVYGEGLGVPHILRYLCYLFEVEVALYVLFYHYYYYFTENLFVFLHLHMINFNKYQSNPFELSLHARYMSKTCYTHLILWVVLFQITWLKPQYFARFHNFEVLLFICNKCICPTATPCTAFHFPVYLLNNFFLVFPGIKCLPRLSLAGAWSVPYHNLVILLNTCQQRPRSPPKALRSLRAFH